MEITMRREEMRENNGAKKITKVVGVSAIAMMLTMTTMMGALPQKAYAAPSQQVQMIELASTTKYQVVTASHYEHKDGTMEASIQTPKVKGITKAIQKFNQQMANYTKKLEKQYKADVKKAKEQLGGTENGHESITTTFSITCNNDRYLSIQILTTEAMGSTSTTSKAFTLDKKTGKTMALKDFFQSRADYQSVISKEVIAKMEQTMKKDSSHVYYVKGSNIEDVTYFNKIAKNQNFYINKNGKLTIVFDEGDVAPQYMGICKFVIEKQAMKDILKTNIALQ